MEYARRRGVVPASPNTLHAYLSVVRMGVRGFRLQEDARLILHGIIHLQRDLEGMRSTLETATSQTRHALNNLVTLEGALHRVESRIEELSRSGSASSEPARSGTGEDQNQ
jgi:DNA anti-recombination protein RmuC